MLYPAIRLATALSLTAILCLAGVCPLTPDVPTACAVPAATAEATSQTTTGAPFRAVSATPSRVASGTAGGISGAVSGKAPDGATSALSPREALRQVEKSRNLQTEMPAAKQEMRKEDLPPRDLPNPDLSFNQQVMKIILYGAIIAILVVIAMNLRGNLWSESRSRRLTREAEEEIGAAAVERLDKAQHAADEMAAAGNYAEAMHLLLLQGVNELRLRLDISIASSLTSREIARQVELSAHGRQMFMDMVQRVEISYFGSYQAGPDDYWACRNSYDELAASLLELISRQTAQTAQTAQIAQTTQNATSTPDPAYGEQSA